MRHKQLHFDTLLISNYRLSSGTLQDFIKNSASENKNKRYEGTNTLAPIDMKPERRRSQNNTKNYKEIEEKNGQSEQRGKESSHHT